MFSNFKSTDADLSLEDIVNHLDIIKKNQIYITYKVDRILKFLVENMSPDYKQETLDIEDDTDNS